ncbi:MAG: 1-deoxy-D-xylulose-5-phosphate reductoisomerase [Phycisphaeraceae bacterium]
MTEATSTTSAQPDASAADPRRLIILGSTGSIGTNTLDVVNRLNGRFRVEALAAGANADLLTQQADQFGVTRLAMADEAAAEGVRSRLPGAQVHAGEQAAEQLVEETDADMLVAAIVGAAGLPATIAGIRKGMHVALANKETLVAAGELVMPLVREHKVSLLPVDSEHSAIFQCLQTGADGQNSRAIKRIVLTASGGPFRHRTAEEIRNATVEQALNHPTWSMGRKISIDSATMMNKALEIIEAHWLFELSADQIGVIVHPQSIAHSFVEFADHSILAQLGSPDMRTPIQYALTYPDRAVGSGEPLDWTALSQLDFEQPDFQRFPALNLAYRVIETGGTSGAILNAANEEAVYAFLDRLIPFGAIVDLAAQALDQLEVEPATNLATIHRADRAARQFVRQQIER